MCIRDRSVYEGYDIDLITNQPKKDEKGNPKRLDSFTTAEGEDSIAIGSGAYVHQSTNGGQGIFDNGKQRATESSIAIGTNAGTGVYRSIAIGNTAEAVPIKMFDSDYKKDDSNYKQNGAGGEAAVSYTHLTLPTTERV